MNTVAPAAGRAVASLADLATGLRNVQSSIVTPGGTPFLRMLTDGSWVFGQENTEVDDSDLWAINPLTITHGWCSWTNYPKEDKRQNAKVGEIMVPVTVAAPLQHTLEQNEWGWKQQISLELVCVDGPNKGVSTRYNVSSVGGLNEVKALIDEIAERAGSGNADIVPIVGLGSDHYPHKRYGKTYTPVLDVEEWVDMNTTELTPKEEPAKAEPAKAETKAAPEPEQEPEQETKTNAPQRRRRR